MKLYTFRGKTQSLPKWAVELRIPEGTLRSRLGKLGMSVEEAFTRPVNESFRPTPNPPAAGVDPPPKLERHVSGAGRCRWTEFSRRREKTFPAYGTAECAAAYVAFCREWYAQHGRPAPTAGEVASVSAVIVRYTEYAEQTFRKHGKMTSEVYGVRAALKRVNESYGGTPAADFGPSKLRTVMDALVRSGLSRKTINDYRDKVVRCWRWAAGRELVTAAVADALGKVERLVAGRTEATESEAVTGVPDEDVDKVLPHLHPDPARNAVLSDLVRALRVTGMRPGEGCHLRASEVDRSLSEWLYLPPNKTLHLDKNRRVWIGPRGQTLLGPLLDAAAGMPGGWVFVLPRYRGEGVVRVSEQFLRLRLAAACVLASVPTFTPNQLRHARAAEIHDRYEDDAAVAAALGNSPEVSRQVYIDNPADKVARRIARELG